MKQELTEEDHMLGKRSPEGLTEEGDIPRKRTSEELAGKFTEEVTEIAQNANLRAPRYCYTKKSKEGFIICIELKIPYKEKIQFLTFKTKLLHKDTITNAKRARERQAEDEMDKAWDIFCKEIGIEIVEKTDYVNTYKIKPQTIAQKLLKYSHKNSELYHEIADLFRETLSENTNMTLDKLTHENHRISRHDVTRTVQIQEYRPAWDDKDVLVKRKQEFMAVKSKSSFMFESRNSNVIEADEQFNDVDLEYFYAMDYPRKGSKLSFELRLLEPNENKRQKCFFHNSLYDRNTDKDGFSDTGFSSVEESVDNLLNYRFDFINCKPMLTVNGATILNVEYSYLINRINSILKEYWIHTDELNLRRIVLNLKSSDKFNQYLTVSFSVIAKCTIKDPNESETNNEDSSRYSMNSEHSTENSFNLKLTFKLIFPATSVSLTDDIKYFDCFSLVFLNENLEEIKVPNKPYIDKAVYSVIEEFHKFKLHKINTNYKEWQNNYKKNSYIMDDSKKPKHISGYAMLDDNNEQEIKFSSEKLKDISDFAKWIYDDDGNIKFLKGTMYDATLDKPIIRELNSLKIYAFHVLGINNFKEDEINKYLEGTFIDEEKKFKLDLLKRLYCKISGIDFSVINKVTEYFKDFLTDKLPKCSYEDVNKVKINKYLPKSNHEEVNTFKISKHLSKLKVSLIHELEEYKKTCQDTEHEINVDMMTHMINERSKDFLTESVITSQGASGAEDSKTLGQVDHND